MMNLRDIVVEKASRQDDIPDLSYFLKKRCGLKEGPVAYESRIQIYVARHTETREVLGICQVTKDTGHIYRIGVAKPYQHNGIGTKLITQMAGELSTNKVSATPSNGSKEFYKRLGMKWNENEEYYIIDRQKLV